MKWDITYLPEALDDLRRLDGSQRILVRMDEQMLIIVIGHAGRFRSL